MADRAPSIVGPDVQKFVVQENTTARLFDFNTNDPDGDAPRYSLRGADAEVFSIDASRGYFAFRSAPDFENPRDEDRNNRYEVDVISTTNGKSDSVKVTVVVKDEAEGGASSGGGRAPEINNARSSFTVAENTSGVFYDFNTTKNGSGSLVYSLEGTDANDFRIDSATGKIRFASAPDFENPADNGGNNTYNVTVRATVGSRSDTEALTVKVSNVNDGGTSTGAAPEIVNPNDRFTVTEGFTGEIFDFNTNVPGGGTVRYSLSGNDAGDLTINERSGKISFKSAPDFENPADSNQNNIYSATVISTANGQTDTVDIQVRVEDDGASRPASDIPNVDGFYTTEFQNGNPYIKVQFEDFGRNPGSKWKFWSSGDQVGNQSNFQGNGYYEWNDGGYSGNSSRDSQGNNRAPEGTELSYVVYVAEAGVYNLRVRNSRDDDTPFDKWNDIWVNIDDFDGRDEDYEDFVPNGTPSLVSGNGAVKLFGYKTDEFATNNNDRFAERVDSKSHDIPNPDAKLDLDEGFYEISWWGRSSGFHIDYFELYMDDAPSLNAPDSDFIPETQFDDFGF